MWSPSTLNMNRNWHFVIKPLYSLIMLLGIAICFSAAIWQYEKSVFYRAPIAQIAHIQGQFLNKYSHYLDNQTLNGQVGYAVITPFKYENQVYLVNRGFVAYVTRDQLPEIHSVNGNVTIEGRLKINHKPLLLNESLQDPIQSRIQFVDEKYFSQLTGLDVVDELFLQTSGSGLLEMQKITEPYLNHHKHQAYAVQWFILGVCGVIILVVASIKRGKADA